MSEQLPLRASAPAKINLGLFLGPPRAQDDRHELASVVQAISLADELTLELGDEGQDGDEVRCPGLALADGEQNLAGTALRLFREATRWDARPLRLNIAKRVPVAAGLGGGSADAAAALRLASAASSLGSHALLLELASRLGADVPAQLAPGRWLIAGAGERLHELPPPSHPFGVLLLPAATGLSTAAVFAQADTLGLGRSPAALKHVSADLRGAFELGAVAPARRELLHNDLEAAAIALCPEIEPSLEQALDAGADAAFVSGSGPTVVGLFLRANGPGRAERAVAGLAGREPAPLCATSLDARLTAIDNPVRAIDSPVRNNHDR